MAEKSNDADLPRPGDLIKGTKIGRYRIDRVVGRGGMGTVYAAFDEDTKRDVAIKVLLPGLPDLLKERFLAECEAEAKIRHPHVMPVYDRGTFEGDRLYFVMELVYEPITLGDVVSANMKGLTAQRWPRLRHWAAPKRLIQDVLVPICDGVDAANHDHGIFHRDLKPDNVLIDVRTRRPYLIDFGICHRRGIPVDPGKIIGTPRFLSPEQAHGKIDDRTDVWGLGAMIYYVFCGRPPIETFSSLRREERARMIADLQRRETEAGERGEDGEKAELSARRAALEDPDLRTVDDMIRDAREGQYGPMPDNVPAAARAIVTKAMATDPKMRYATGAEVAEDLRAWIAGGRVQALAEQTTTGAAVDAARRTIRRHVTTALWVLLGIAVGVPLGQLLLTGADEAKVTRKTAFTEELDLLERELDQLAAYPSDSIEGAVRWRMLERRISDAKSRVRGLSEEEGGPRGLERLTAIERRMPTPVFHLETNDSGPWELRSVVDHRMISIQPGDNPLAPGPYSLIASRVKVPFLVPLAVGAAAVSKARIAIDLPRGGVPPEMIYVPAGPPAVGEEALPAFFLGRQEVTCGEFAEWIDELDDEGRPFRLPPEGFMIDRNIPGRYLVDPDYEDKPVAFIRPEDAAAYAAWRSEIYGVDVRLPTEAEWRRAAGGELLGPAGAAFFVPLSVSGSRLVADRTPYNARNLLSNPPEIVTTSAGYGLKARGPGLGIPPSEEAFARTAEAPANVRCEAGFRLVQPVP